jgi:hypothetical protein
MADDGGAYAHAHGKVVVLIVELVSPQPLFIERLSHQPFCTLKARGVIVGVACMHTDTPLHNSV